MRDWVSVVAVAVMLAVVGFCGYQTGYILTGLVFGMLGGN